MAEAMKVIRSSHCGHSPKQKLVLRFVHRQEKDRDIFPD